jgi:hypothetical protein
VNKRGVCSHLKVEGIGSTLKLGAVKLKRLYFYTSDNDK